MSVGSLANAPCVNVFILDHFEQTAHHFAIISIKILKVSLEHLICLLSHLAQLAHGEQNDQRHRKVLLMKEGLRFNNLQDCQHKVDFAVVKGLLRSLRLISEIVMDEVESLFDVLLHLWALDGIRLLNGAYKVVEAR